MATLSQMDADDLIKQGRDLAGKLRDGAGEQVAQHEGQIKSVLGKVVAFVNDKTGGKYSDQVGKAAGFVEHQVDVLATSGRPGDTPGAAPDSAAPGTTEATAPEPAASEAAASEPAASEAAAPEATAPEPAAGPPPSAPVADEQPPPRYEPPSSTSDTAPPGEEPPPPPRYQPPSG